MAKVCPYCGHRAAPGAGGGGEGKAHSEGRPGGEARERGRFRGSLEDAGGQETRREAPRPTLENLLRFLLHPGIPAWSKALPFLALFYVLSPLDLLPGLLVPGAGWLDDFAVLFLTWRHIAAALRSVR